MKSPAATLADPGPDQETQFFEGFLVGILVGEGHFGGDGKQPQVTLRMHSRHAELFHWLERHFPGGRVYGPYHHGGRDYMQWMARGQFLRGVLLPILERRLTPEVDAYALERFAAMKSRYPAALGLLEERPDREIFSTPTT